MRTLFALILVSTSLAVGAQPAGVTRVLRSFDFEERRLGNPEELPMHWTKVVGAGLPHYVNGHLTTDMALSGQYSFQFDLNGGSLVYRYEAGRIKVQRGAHYRVEGFVRTTPLAHARARMSAYLCDVDKRPIPSTVRHSDLYAAKHADDPWTKLGIELNSDTEAAESLVLELELLQPQLYANDTLGSRTIYPQDIRGSAWFDDVTIAQVPHVTLSTDRPGNIFRRSDPLQLRVVVDDPFTDDLAAQLVIKDAQGSPVFQRSGAAEMRGARGLGPLKKQMVLALPELKPGWYQVSLVMSSQGKYLGMQALDMVRLADDIQRWPRDDRFGVIATDLAFDGWPRLPVLLSSLGAGRVKLAIWNRTSDVESFDPAAFDNMLVKLQELHIVPTACLLDLPPSLNKKLEDAQGTGAIKAGESSWLRLLKAKPDDWQPQLAFLIARHATHLDRWQLGADNSDAFVTQPGMRQVYALLYKQFAALTQRPDLAMPWPAWYEMEGTLPATVALSVPPSVLPPQLPLYMQDMKAHEGHNLSISLQLLDRDKYGRDVQIRDLAQRVIYAMAADAKRIDLPLPFAITGSGDEISQQPSELFIIIRTLMTTLSGAMFKGTVPIAEGVEAFLFDRNGEGILVLWDTGREGGVKQLALNLGDAPRQLDLWGNATPLLRPANDKNPGNVQLVVGLMPTFLTDIDGPLAQLRASVALDRPLIESTFRSHTRRLQFRNAYGQTIGGTIKLKPPTGWSVSPSVLTFSLNPGETFDRELTIDFPYNSYAGPKTINADFVIQGERTTSFSMPIIVKLGLSDVGMQTLALRDGKDVVVQQIVQNYGDTPIDYSAFAVYPGQTRQERLVTNLAPGRTVIKRYRFPNVQFDPTARVRVGVKELEGTRILNDEVEVR